MTGPNTLETNGVGSPAIFQPLPKPGDNCHRDEPAQGEPCKVAGRAGREARIFNLSYAAGIASVYAERIIDLEDRVAALENWASRVASTLERK
jgi:hypothetical protein